MVCPYLAVRTFHFLPFPFSVVSLYIVDFSSENIVGSFHIVFCIVK